MLNLTDLSQFKDSFDFRKTLYFSSQMKLVLTNAQTDRYFEIHPLLSLSSLSFANISYIGKIDRAFGAFFTNFVILIFYTQQEALWHSHVFRILFTIGKVQKVAQCRDYSKV